MLLSDETTLTLFVFLTPALITICVLLRKLYVKTAILKDVRRTLNLVDEKYKLYLKLEKEDIRLSYEKKYKKLQHSLDEREAALKIDIKQYESRLADGVQKRIREILSNASKRPYFSDTLVFRELRDPELLADNSRFQRAITEPLSISASVCISADIKSKENQYQTSLNSCTCQDFVIHHSVCKHMFRLAVDMGLLSAESEALRLTFSRQIAQLNHTIQVHKLHLRDYDHNKALRKEIDKIRSDSFESTAPWIAAMIADHIDESDRAFNAALSPKKTTPSKSSEEKAKLRKEKREAVRKYTLLEYQLLIYESLFPWLPEYRTVTPSDVERLVELSGATDESGENEYSSMRHWLSPDEYASLSSCEKYQLALDRYMSRSKSNWEIGIEYERYVGYLYEQDGYTVTYSGALQKLEDMGRDLIAQKGDVIHVVQCKRWAKEKVIHEKHIFQLYGTCILLTKEHPWHTIVPVFYTTTELSDTAKYCAKKMGVQIHDNCQYIDYPIINCNFSNSVEKIYHLPFDMQYDRIIIEKENGESYVRTVAEAEASGFRRAHRWRSRQGETVAASSAE